MIDITQIFFLDDNDLSKNKQKSSILARWDYDYENYLWDNMKEEREEKENHGQTGTEVCLVDNERKIQYQTYDDASAISQKR